MYGFPQLGFLADSERMSCRVIPCLFILALTSVAQCAPGDDLQGTWELAGGTGFRKGIRCLKHITESHETWIYFDPVRKSPIGSAGGHYETKGSRVTVTFEFASPGYEHLLKAPQTLTYRATGKALTITGKIDGRELKQTWIKLK